MPFIYISRMRWVLFFFSMYLLALSVMPCSDTTVSEGDTVTSISDANTEHHHAHQLVDTCSPFCSCACCTHTLVLLHPLHLPISPYIPTFTAQLISFSDVSFYTTYLSQLEKPPRKVASFFLA